MQRLQQVLSLPPPPAPRLICLCIGISHTSAEEYVAQNQSQNKLCCCPVSRSGTEESGRWRGTWCCYSCNAIHRLWKSEFIVSQLIKRLVLYTICGQDPVMLIGLSNELKTLHYFHEIRGQFELISLVRNTARQHLNIVHIQTRNLTDVKREECSSE